MNRSEINIFQVRSQGLRLITIFLDNFSSRIIIFWFKKVSTMKKLSLLLLLSASLSTFAADLDFWSSESFCYESPNVQNRNGVFYLPNQQEPFTGENLCVYLNNSQYHSQGNMLNGLPAGKWTWWYESGMKWQEHNHKDGKLDGKQTIWHQNGQVGSEGNFKDDLNDGKWTWWYENGQKEQEGNYKDGKLDGKFTKWYENGQKREEFNVKDDILDGIRTKWKVNGQWEQEATFKNGECVSGQCNPFMWY